MHRRGRQTETRITPHYRVRPSSRPEIPTVSPRGRGVQARQTSLSRSLPSLRHDRCVCCGPGPLSDIRCARCQRFLNNAPRTEADAKTPNRQNAPLHDTTDPTSTHPQSRLWPLRAVRAARRPHDRTSGEPRRRPPPRHRHHGSQQRRQPGRNVRRLQPRGCVTSREHQRAHLRLDHLAPRPRRTKPVHAKPLSISTTCSRPIIVTCLHVHALQRLSSYTTQVSERSGESVAEICRRYKTRARRMTGIDVGVGRWGWRGSDRPRRSKGLDAFRTGGNERLVADRCDGAAECGSAQGVRVGLIDWGLPRRSLRDDVVGRADVFPGLFDVEHGVVGCGDSAAASGVVVRVSEMPMLGGQCTVMPLPMCMGASSACSMRAVSA